MATIKLQRSSDFITAIFLRLELGQALSDGRSFEQPVLIERMKGASERFHSLIKIEGELVHIEVFREGTSQYADLYVPVTMSPMDAEEVILSLTLELLLS